MKKIILGLMLFATMIASSQEKKEPKKPEPKQEAPKEETLKFTGRIDRFKDADTYVFTDFGSKQRFTIRLAGVDAPEKKQSFGDIATQKVVSILQEVDYVVTIQIIAKDVYGRYVAWVYYGKETNINLSETLLQNGLAWHYKEYDKSEVLQTMEDKAREHREGLWEEKEPIYPSEFRKSKKRR